MPMQHIKIVFLLIVILFFSSCSKQKEERQLIFPVKAMRVEPNDIDANYSFVGVAESSHIVELRARVEGYLEQISYNEGDLIKKGELMFTLDQRPFIAAVNMAKGELEKQKANLWNATQTKNRMVPLYEQNAVSQRDFDNAIAGELEAKANVETAQANLEKAEINLSYTSIQAPVTGMASRAIYREGALISPGPNSLLTNIFVIDPIWVNFSVSEGDILKAREEMQKKQLVMPKDNQFKIEVIMADGSVVPAFGKIDFLDPALQQSTGTMLVRSIMKNPNGWLKPGQFVRVVVKGATRPNAIVVPQTAVQQGQKGIFVFVIKGDTVEMRPVETGEWYENYWIIHKGLKEGDVVVVDGVNRLQNNSKVKITTMVPSLPKPQKVDKEYEYESLLN